MNHKNPKGERRCYLCHKSLPLTIEFFPRDKNRSAGLGYQCRPCALRVRKERGDPRKNRWSKMTPEERAARYIVARQYYHGAGRPSVLLAAYRSVDKKRGLTCDITIPWFREHIETKPCFYCGETVDKRGCDRVDNAKGHSMDNVVPCCALCNFTRTNRFTHKEMLTLGEAIKQIKLVRAKN